MCRPKFFVFSHDYTLAFMTREEYEDFKREELELIHKYKTILQAKYGFWAGNQGKYVATREELNSFDGEG